MSVSEGEQVDDPAPGLPQLGARLLIGALLMVAVLLFMQRWGADERRERQSFALSSGTIRISDLSVPVEILRDARGIPHVIARREAEGWFGLGFAHGQDRLAQMAWLRRRAQGRTAELEGEAALPADRLARILEIARTAEAGIEGLPVASRSVLEAYAAGVNARISRIRQGRVSAPRMLAGSIEELEEWRPADSLAVVKLLSWCIGGTLETTLVLDDLIQRLDSMPARPFFPGRASIDFGIAPDLGTRRRPADATAAHAQRSGAFGSTRALCRGIGLPTGGAWVLDGSMSESGAPILVADWHVEPAVPALFYEVHIEAGGLDVAGATLPGSPILWAGRNRHFAWAGVPASAPVADLFIETLREDRGLYQNGTLWVPLEEREEILRWRDARGVVQESTMHLRSTRHGPLIEGLTVSGEAGDTPIANDAMHAARALAWTGARVGDGLTSMLALLRLRDAEGVVAALTQHHEPVLAVAYADQAGQGGVQVAGWLPRRPLPTGLVPVQGRLRSFDWRERVAIETLPGQKLGAGRKPWALAMDQPWPQRGGLSQMEWLWRAGDRGARLEFELERRLGEGPLDLRAAAELLQDDHAQRAPRVVASILALARRSESLPIEAAEIALLLERWDGDMGAASAAAAAYHLVIEHLIENLLLGPFGPDLFRRYLEAPHVRPQFAIERLVLRAAKVQRAGGWTDQGRVSEAARASLRETWLSLNHRLGPTRERWSWGRLHRLRFLPFGAQRNSMSRLKQSLPVQGSGQTLALSAHRPGLSFDVERAGLYRVAMDLASSDRLLSSLAPGQSEHPGHPHFSDGIGRWASSRLSLFVTSRLVIEEESAERLLLEPAP
jgi:penicillin amidase